MLYQFVRNTSLLGLQVYFKKIYVTGRENIPKNQPIIFAANHTNGLLDPVAIGTHLPYPIHFITRGDVFIPATVPIFKRLNMMPIYRIRDGYHLLTKNEETFARSYKLLKKGEKIVIFSEGDCASEKQLRPLKKGTARMAFEALTSHNTDPFIIPVSINYTKHTGFRGDLIVHFNEGFKTSDFKTLLNQNKARAIRAFNKKLQSSLKPNLVHLDNLENRELLDTLLEIKRSELNIPILPITELKSEQRLRTEIQVADYINELSDEDDVFSVVKQNALQFKHQINKRNLNINTLGRKSNPLLLFLLLLVSPIFVFVLALNGLTYVLASALTKAKVKQDIFVSTFRCFLMIFTYVPYLLILLIIGTLIWGWWAIPIILLMPILTILAVNYKDWLQLEWNKAKYQIFKRQQPTEAARLLKTKAEILKLLDSPK